MDESQAEVKVMEYTNTVGNLKATVAASTPYKAEIKLSTYSFKDVTFYIVIHDPYDREECVRRAREREGEKQYSFLRKNCEHFANWCVYGVETCEQVNTCCRNCAGVILARIGAILVKLLTRVIIKAIIEGGVIAGGSQIVEDETNVIVNGTYTSTIMPVSNPRVNALSELIAALFGAVVEISFMSYDIHTARKKNKEGSLNGHHFADAVAKRVVIALVSIICMITGSVLVQVYCTLPPALEAFLGGFLGAVVGYFIGAIMGCLGVCLRDKCEGET